MPFYVYFCITKPAKFDPLAFCEGLTKLLLSICEVGSSTISTCLRQNRQQNSSPWLSQVYSEVNAGLSRGCLISGIARNLSVRKTLLFLIPRIYRDSRDIPSS